MKQVLSAIIGFLFLSSAGFSQNIGIGTNTPDPSAKLEVSSNNSGFLPPRMTNTERNAIASPASGLMIYNTTTDCLEMFGKGKWNSIYCVPVDSNSLVTDIDGNTYPTVKICDQTWMAKNLDVARYRNGDIIPQVTDPTQWANLTTGAWCWYNNDSATYGSVYGRLYNWYAVNDPRGLAPEGWHVPSDGEWASLTNCLGGVAIAGGKMKEIGISHWISPNLGATNSSGFNGLPAGTKSPSGNYSNVGNRGRWWSSTEFNLTNAWRRGLDFDSSSVNTLNQVKQNGFSIRCVKDTPVTTLNNGLVAYYPFNGNANDESGNGNNGTVNGATLTTDRFGNSGKAYDFNGISNFIEVPTLNNLQYRPIAFSVWIKPSSLVTIDRPLGNAVAIMGRDLCGQGIQGQLLVWNYPTGGVNQQVTFYTGNSGFNFNYSPNLNSWTHLAFIWDETDTMRLYANGNLIQNQYFSSAGFVPNGIIPFRIGAGSGDCTINTVGRYFWNGQIDDARIYNRALTQSEITYLATH